MIYGYARISTNKQSIDRQIRNIQKDCPKAIILTEVYTGTKTDRPQWQKLLKTVKCGDTIIFDSVSRMSRNAEEGFRQYREFYDNGIALRFIKEPYINTATFKTATETAIQMTGTSVDIILEAINRYLFTIAEEQIKIAFEQSQKEVDDLHQRTAEGIMTARLNGKQIGNKLGSHRDTKKGAQIKEAIKKYSRDFGGALTDEDVMKIVGASRNTYYKYKREMKIA